MEVRSCGKIGRYSIDDRDPGVFFNDSGSERRLIILGPGVDGSFDQTAALDRNTA